MPLTSKEKFILFALGVVVVSFMSIAFIWSANDYYANAYKVPHQQSQQLKKKVDAYNARHGGEEESSQPRSRGVSEKDIKKSEGRRYRTF